MSILSYMSILCLSYLILSLSILDIYLNLSYFILPSSYVIYLAYLSIISIKQLWVEDWNSHEYFHQGTFLHFCEFLGAWSSIGFLSYCKHSL